MKQTPIKNNEKQSMALQELWQIDWSRSSLYLLCGSVGRRLLSTHLLQGSECGSHLEYMAVIIHNWPKGKKTRQTNLPIISWIYLSYGFRRVLDNTDKRACHLLLWVDKLAVFTTHQSKRLAKEHTSRKSTSHLVLLCQRRIICWFPPWSQS